jgi:outer membrane protein assembly factor BamD (BamD/ComL family)
MLKSLHLCLLPAALLTTGCCLTGAGSPWAAIPPTGVTYVRHQATVESAAGQVAAGRPLPSAEMGVVRGQDGSDAGLWTVPSWDKIKQSPIVNNALKIVGRDRNETLAREQFAQAEGAFKEKRFDDAASLYKKAARHWPDSALEEDALFMLGDCYFFLDKYPEAGDAYGELLKKYDNSRHLDKVVVRQFKVAQYWLELERYRPRQTLNPNLLDKTRPTWDTRGNALKAFESVRLYDPTGPLADDSVLNTAAEHFANDRFDDADYFFSLLRSEYPKSEHLIKAYILGLQAKLNKYDGPMYDSTSLIEAEELIDQMLTQFPAELGKERERVIMLGKAVRYQMAQRDYEMAEFYCKTGHYGAASIYFNNVIKDFPETQLAQMSRDRLAEIKDLPPEPPQRLTWLANLFPGQSKRRFK